MREITYKEAVREAMREEMLRDKTVVIFGEDMAENGGAWGVTQGLLKEFGPRRILNTPVSEIAIAGAAVGAGAAGLRPLAEIMFSDFMTCAADQIVNQLAKLRYMSGGQYCFPVTIRTAMGGGMYQAAQHSQCLMAMFMCVPGLKIVCPSTPYDAKGILKSAIRDNNPVLVFEHLLLYNIKGEVPKEEYTIPLGKADVKRKGKDITIIAISETVTKSLNVAERMKDEGIDIEVIDPISLVPLDMDTIISSVKKTGRVIVVYTGTKSSGPGTEIVARINELAFKYLKCPIYRVAEKDVPNPFSPVLEKYVLPQEEDIENSVKELMNMSA